MYKEIGIAGTGKFRRMAEYAAQHNCYMLVAESKVERYIRRIVGYGLNPDIIRGLSEREIEYCYESDKDFVIYDIESALREFLGDGFVGYSYSVDSEAFNSGVAL